MFDLLITHPTADDACWDILRLIMLADKAAFLDLSGQKTLHDAFRLYEQHYSHPDSYCNPDNLLIARSGKRIVGCILFFDGAREKCFRPLNPDIPPAVAETCAGEFYIDSLSTDPECRRKGIARQLIHQVILKATEAGARQVTLLADTQIPFLREMYEKMGFRITGKLYSFGRCYFRMALSTDTHKCNTPVFTGN